MLTPLATRLSAKFMAPTSRTLRGDCHREPAPKERRGDLVAHDETSVFRELVELRAIALFAHRANLAPLVEALLHHLDALRVLFAADLEQRFLDVVGGERIEHFLLAAAAVMMDVGDDGAHDVELA